MKTVVDATCTACGCTCDDIALAVDGDKLTASTGGCELGRAWFESTPRTAGPACTIDGRPATVEEGIDRAARLLLEAKYPLVYGLRGTTCETQRTAVAVADALAALLDTPTSSHHGPTGVTFQGVGEVTASLGEIRHRGDLLIFWGTNPAKTHPRFFERYTLDAPGQFLPQGRADRYAVVIDVARTATAATANEFIQIQPGGDFEALWILRAIVKGLAVDANDVLAETGVPLEVWQTLAARMKQARFGVFLFGPGLAETGGRYLNVEALLALTRDLNAHTRFVARAMHGRGNAVGADNVLTWQTGFPFAVNLARGYPRYSTGEYAADTALTRGEVDAALIVANDPARELGAAAAARLRTIPTVVIDSRETPTLAAATIAFRTAVPGIDTTGTVYRLDEVSLPLRASRTSTLPTDREILTRLEQRIRAR